MVPTSLIPWLFLFGCVFYVIIRRRQEPKFGSIIPVNTTEILWKIPDASSKLIANLKLTSENISFAGHQWFLELQKLDEGVTLTLMKMDSPSAFPHAYFYLGIGIKHADEGEYLSSWLERKVGTKLNSNSVAKWRSTGPGVQYLFRDTQMWMPGGVLTLFVRLSIHSTSFFVLRKYSYDFHNPFNNAENDKDGNTKFSSNVEKEEGRTSRLKVLDTLSQNLKDLYLNDEECDVTIKVKNEVFRAHRLILKSRSPVLAAMFSHSMTESNTGEIHIDDCDPKAFAVFLLFLYSGAVDDLSTDNVIPVYYIADKYDLRDLKDACSRYMLSNLTVRSVSNVISIAATHDESRLLERAIEFFLRNADDIFPTVEWQKFMSDNPTQANELVIKALKYAKEKK